MAIKFLSGLNLSNVTAGSILKLDSNGNIVAATAGTDYVSSSTWSTASNSNIYYNSGGVRIGTYQSSVDAAAQLHVFDYQTTDPKLLIEDGNTGDASMQFKISTQQYTMGIDNSDSDKFILAASSALGTTNAIEVSTTGVTQFGNDIKLSNGWTLTTASTSYAKFGSWVNVEGTGLYTTSDIFMDLDDSSSRFVIRGLNNTEHFIANTATDTFSIPNWSLEANDITQTSSGDNWYNTATVEYNQTGIKLSRSNSGYVSAAPYKLIGSFTASVSFKTSNCTHLGIIFAALPSGTDNNNYGVILRNNGDNGTEVRVQKRVGGSQSYPITAVNVTSDCDDGNWHELTVSYNGKHIVVDIDGTNYIDQAWTDTSFTDPGYVGLAIYDNTCQFNDFQVTETPSTTTFENLNLANGNRTLDVKLATTPSTGDVGVQFRSGSGDYLGLAAGGGTGVGLVVDSSNNVGIGTISPSTRFSVRATTATHKLVGINRANSDVAALYLGNNSSNDAIISGNNAPISLGKDVSGTYTEYVNIATDGELKFSAYGAGILKTNASGIVSVDTSTYVTDVDWSDIASINGIININSTTQIGQGDTETLVSFQNSGTERGSFEVDDSANSYFVATGFKTATASTGFLKADGTVDTGDFFSGAYSDLSGTPTLGTMAAASTSDYKTSDATETYVGQELASYTPTSSLGTAATSAATDFVAVTGDEMTGNLTLKRGHGDITFLTLKQENTSGDLVEQKSFIDFKFVDGNTNETPQVRIGAEVGNNDGSASDLYEEGSGAFVVYTNNADTESGEAGTSLAERLRVDYSGNLKLNAYTAGILKTDANGNVSLDTSTYLTTTAAANTYTTTDHTHTDATTESSGFMSATDKTKLNNITDGAEPNVQVDWNEATTTADAYIKNKPTLGTASASAATDFVAVAGDTMTGTLALDNADSLSFESGRHWITYNDGEGNFNIRVGHKSDSTPNEVSTETGYAFHDEWSQSSGWREFNVSGASITAGNDVGTWYRQMYYDYNDVRLSYRGGLKFQTTNTGITVTGEIVTTGGNSTNWTTAYTYSQVGHLPLSGGTLTGGIVATSGYFGSTSSSPQVQITTEGSTASIADTFTDTTTDKSYIYFTAGTSSSDPGYIMHETSNGTSPDERNEGVLHLVPSDDNSTGDYVSIHGTNDADVLKLHTSGLIETATGYQLVLKSGNAAAKVDDTLHVTGRLYVDTLDANTTSTSALVEGASGEIEKRTLGSNAFTSTTIPTGTAASKAVTDFIQDFGTTSIQSMNTLAVASGKYRWNNQTEGRPASAQDNEYGTLLHLNYDGTSATQLAHDIAESNLWIRSLDTSSDTGTTWVQIADTGYVDAAVADLVDSAPAALDTLNELAAALGDDASFSTTMSTALGNRLRVDVNNQSLTSTQKANGRTNLGLGSAATAASTAFVAVSGDTMTGNLTMSSATPTLKFSINGAENNAGIVWEDGDAGDPSAQAAAIKWDASSNHMRFYNNDEAAERMRINSDGTTTFLGTINASAGISGLTLANGGISGANYNITGVNQLEIADPGEGIVFKSGSSGDMTLAIVDDANDNILRFSGTTAKFDVDGELIATSITSANGIYHEGDTDTSITFSTDTINVNTGGGSRINITDSTTNVYNDLIIAGGETFSLGERANGDDNGRTVLIEGVAGESSGEGSGRIFFSEHNSSDAAADSYGLSLYYEGNPNAQLPSGFQPNTGNATWSLRRHDNSVNGAAIMSGIRTSNNVTFSGTVTVAGRMYVSTVDANATSTTALVLGASNEIEKRTLGSNAFNSTAYLEDISPATPSVDSTAVVGETIEITFSQSSTPDVDYYQVWSAVGSSTGSYGMIAHIPQEDVASSMTVIDATFSVSDTMYYRVYAVKSGIYSTAGTANRAFSAAALDVANMSVVNLNTAYYIQYEMPDSRFVDHVEIYMDAEATASNLTRTGATLVYSGNNTSYMYKIGANDLDKYHQFWVEVVES